MAVQTANRYRHGTNTGKTAQPYSSFIPQLLTRASNAHCTGEGLCGQGSKSAFCREVPEMSLSSTSHPVPFTLNALQGLTNKLLWLKYFPSATAPWCWDGFCRPEGQAERATAPGFAQVQMLLSRRTRCGIKFALIQHTQVLTNPYLAVTSHRRLPHKGLKPSRNHTITAQNGRAWAE